MAVGMLITGADGETRRQMLDVLGFNTDDPLLVNIYCANLLKNAPLIDPKVTLSIANSIYVNSGKKVMIK
jgi:serpin B